MKRPLVGIGFLFLVTGLGVAFWVNRTRPASSPRRESLNDTIQSAISNPVAFAKARFTGGVGARLLADPATGLPMIQQVVVGSPAEQAGLRMGDLILQVDGITTSGRALAQNVESIRGFAGGSVTLTIQRSGSTNLKCTIHRSSWKSLGIPQ